MSYNNMNTPGGGRAFERIKADFTARCKANTKTRWIRFGIVSLVFFLWVIWLGNPWVGLLWLLLFDIYITGYIPLTWWRKSKSKATRTVMGWVDAIVYALVLVYFIFAFLGQNYQIPSSSLEKTLLTGDYLLVNKTTYGPRVPQTPLHFPLAQHTMPIIGGKSYIDGVQLDYHRLPGLRNVERFDIVVFNAPCTDTVALGIPSEVSFYEAVYDLENLAQQPVQDGRAEIMNNPQKYGEVVVRPVDRRENFVKRAIGLPGERIKIVDDIVYINGKPLPEPEYVQHNYAVPVNDPITDEQWEKLGVALKDVRWLTDMTGNILTDMHGSQLYDVPLTQEMLAEIKDFPQVSGEINVRRELLEPFTYHIFPLWGNPGWSLQNMGEFWIPKQGSTLHLTLNNLPVYRRVIEAYEGNKVAVKNGKIYINGEQKDYYTFKLDYYWMMGDNRDNSSDSRFWGFVPEDHIVGTPVSVLISFDGEKSFPGNIRWNRILKTANPDK
ncbi:MAG: S26 family signal peptidase [Prevotella sp.]|nr:S26 family signal peptidase [Prevotella sp.]MCM1075589.1 S26 family signal peptidase [Ruminococcus sp.]